MAAAFSVVRVGEVLRASGELDQRAAPTLVAALDPFAGVDVVMDLSAVDYVDSVGVSVLLRARRRNPRLRYVNPSAWVSRLVALGGLSEELFGDAAVEAA